MWQEMLKNASYTPEGSGAVIDYPDAEKAAILAYVEGMMAYNEIMKKWIDSDEIDPSVIGKMVDDHVKDLKERYNVE